MLSIIIPTLNEEHYLPHLLESLQKQDYQDFEVIVADAQSTDATVEIAKNYGSLVVPGGMPAMGRNTGARTAKGEFLLFLDADVIAPPGFLKNVYTEMQERYLDLATCEVIPLSDMEIDKVLHRFTNLYIRISQYSNPHAPGFCIIVTKRLFDRAGGFDESLTMAEDHEFVKRASQFRPLRVLETTSIQTSVRRLEKEGRFVLLQKYLQIELYRIFIGEPRKEVVNYEFGKFQSLNNKKLKNSLADIDQQLEQLNENLSSFSKKYWIIEGQFTESYQKNLELFKKRFEGMKKMVSRLFNKSQPHVIDKTAILDTLEEPSSNTEKMLENPDLEISEFKTNNT